MKIVSCFYKLRYLKFPLLIIATFPIIASTMSDFSKNNIQFSFDLYSKIIDDKSDQNVIISPFSVQTCVALAYVGANGETANEMSQGLKLVSNNRNEVADNFQQILDEFKDSPLLKIANKIYIKDGYELNDEFKEIATKKFNSQAENVDFENASGAAKTINNWVEEKTNQKIKNLISADNIDDLTRMILVNAIHFKGDWAKKFETSNTAKENFFLNENDSVHVDMMNKKDKYHYGQFDELGATAIEMPYANSNLSMLVILPNSKTGLRDLEKKLQQTDLVKLSRDMFQTDVIVKFPKFKIEFSVELTEPLKKMGMQKMFSNYAEFNHLLKSPEELKVSKVVHKAFIEVNEEGTEAAAATAVHCRTKRSIVSLEPPKEFIADHPFCFCILAGNRNNRITLFMGKINHLTTAETIHTEF